MATNGTFQAHLSDLPRLCENIVWAFDRENDWFG
jgi:hypothetical protein